MALEWIGFTTICNGGFCLTIYAVNGKEPSRVWIPSLDTTGNGTTTLNQLIGGGNNGTLTNFAMSGTTSNWVTDTSGGGVRAIAFDGSNDFVNCGSITSLNGVSKASYSGWIYRANSSHFCGFGGNSGDPGEGENSCFGVMWRFDGTIRFFAQDGAAQYGMFALSGTGWNHIVVSYDGTLSGNANRLKVWQNGTARSLSFGGTIQSTLGPVGTIYTLGTLDLANYLQGRIDDVRLFVGATLDGSDASYLYNANTGRGRVTAATNRKTFLMGIGW